MAFTVILDAPGGTGQRAVRGLRVMLGATLKALGGVACVPAVPLAGLSVLAIPFALAGELGEVPAEIADWWWPALWISVTVAIAASTSGGMLLRGQRRLALFLRRFRRSDATDVVAGATREFGLVWRLVTLDDREVQASGVGRGAAGFAAAYDRSHRLAELARRAYRPALLAGGLGLVLMLGTAIALALDAGGDPVRALLSPHGVLAGLLDWYRRIESPWALVFRVGTALLALALAGWLVTVLAVLPSSAFGIFEPLRTAITAAEASKSLTIGDRVSIATVGGRIREQSTKLLSPRLFVIRVDSSVWRETVLTFAKTATVPLIDVTEPTEHVLWEIEELARRHGNRIVLVGDLRELGRMFDRPRVGTPQERLLRLLDGRQVLGYTSDPAGRERFARALRTLLDRSARA